MKIFLLSVWLVFIVIEVYRNYYIIEIQKERPDYLWSFIFRGMVAVVHGVLLDVRELSEWWPVLTYQVTSFWLLFDIGLNLARKQHVMYTGENSGWIFDKLGRWPVVYLLLKLAALFGMIYSIVILL